MRNPLAAHPPWRQIAIVSIALPTVIVLAVLAFAWPAARIAPRDVPVGVVGPAASVESSRTRAGAGRPRVASTCIATPTPRLARTAIEDRDVYGAFVVDGGRVNVLTAGAASPSVAQMLTTAGAALGTESGRTRSPRPTSCRRPATTHAVRC